MKTETQPDLFGAPPRDPQDIIIDDAVKHVMHAMQDSWKRTDKLRNKPATDADVRDLIQACITSQGGYTGPGEPMVNYCGGAVPWVSIDKKVVKGTDLIARVREIFNIREPE